MIAAFSVLSLLTLVAHLILLAPKRLSMSVLTFSSSSGTRATKYLSMAARKRFLYCSGGMIVGSVFEIFYFMKDSSSLSKVYC